jgi:hypothetical protein
MAEITMGNQYNFLRHVVTLESIGQVAVTVGRGVVVGIGTADRGPAMTPYGIAASSASKIKKTYYAGKLKEGLEAAADQGCSIVYGVRVMGSGYAIASLDVEDSLDNVVGTFSATGPGVSGNIPTITIERGDLHFTTVESFAGNGGTTPYALLYNDIYESTVNYVEVAGSRKTLIYTGDPDPGEAKIDKDAATLSFSALEWPTSAQKVEVRYKAWSRKVTITDVDAGTLPMVYNNIKSLTMLAAKMKNDALVTFEAEVGATHLPAVLAATNMAGGLDGDPIVEDDWEAAFNAVVEDLPANVYPSAVFATDYGIEEGQIEIVALMDAFLTKMANKPVGKMSPCQGFITLDQTAEAEDLTDLVAGYNNLFMTLISNGFDNTEADIAGARAGQEASLALGTSPAVDDNSLKGIEGLLFQWDDSEREVLNAAGLEVMIKETGVHPYVGVTTNLDDSFYRTVDVRTICAVIIIVDQIVKKFMNERRTATNLSRMQASIDVLLNKYLAAGVLDTYTLSVTPTESDHNAVDIALKIQPVGHIERVQTWMGVGYYDTTAIAEA